MRFVSSFLGLSDYGDLNIPDALETTLFALCTPVALLCLAWASLTHRPLSKDDREALTAKYSALMPKVTQ